MPLQYQAAFRTSQYTAVYALATVPQQYWPYVDKFMSALCPHKDFCIPGYQKPKIDESSSGAVDTFYLSDSNDGFCSIFYQYGMIKTIGTNLKGVSYMCDAFKDIVTGTWLARQREDGLVTEACGNSKIKKFWPEVRRPMYM